MAPNVWNKTGWNRSEFDSMSMGSVKSTMLYDPVARKYNPPKSIFHFFGFPLLHVNLHMNFQVAWNTSFR
jgi:hypothetical protein